ncbi:MAG: hypothetical protein ACK5LT_00495 [Lachnospirales bacterium]
MIKNELLKRKLPDLLKFASDKKVETPEDWQVRRKEIRHILSREFIGFEPSIAYKTDMEVIRTKENDYGSKAETSECQLNIKSDYSHCTIPFTITLPKNKKLSPIFIYLSFTNVIADGIGEEIIDSGYGIVNLFYQDICADYYDKHMTGLGRFSSRNSFDSWGKLKMWAWTTQRILDVLNASASDIDKKKIAVMGHSRLGKAALIAGAFDERFSLTVSCQSGAGGAALFRGKTGENIENLKGTGSRLWFNGNFFSYKEDELPFDQHFLLSLIAPSHLYVSSAREDHWADPKSEFLSCVATNPAYEILGEKGLIYKDYCKVGEYLHEGKIGYHLRKGGHYLSRDDWQLVMAYRNKNNI